MDNPRQPQPQSPQPSSAPSFAESSGRAQQGFGGAKPPSNLPIGGMEVRTMGSDIKSVQESGGGAPKPFVPGAPSAGSGQVPSAPPIPPRPSFAQVPPTPPAGGPVPPIPPIVPKPPVPSPVPPKSQPVPAIPLPKKSGSKKGFFALILALVLIAGAGVLGYYFVFPLFFGESGEPASDSTSPPASPTDALPSSDSDLFNAPPLALEPEPVSSALPIIPAPPTPAGHISFLSTPADITSKITLESPSAETLRGALGFTTVQVPSLKEVVLKKSDGEAYEFPEIGAALLPEFFTEDLASLLALDFTFAVYTDNKGSWPVYIMEASSGDLALIKERFAGIENAGVAALGNLYLSSPGGSGTWKDGSILGTPGRYLQFTQNGASLNYVWVGNRLVLGTSYNATQEAVRRLGSRN